MELKLDELAERAGVSPRTVRYYIAQGLLPSPGRLGPMTRYGREHLDRLRLVRRLQEERLSLAEIRSALEGSPSVGLPEMSSAPQALAVQDSTAPARRIVLSSQPTESWDRIVVTPDVEIHVRHSAEARARDRTARIVAAVADALADDMESGQ